MATKLEVTQHLGNILVLLFDKADILSCMVGVLLRDDGGSIVVAMKLTECGRAQESATLLRGLQRKRHSTCDAIHLKIEYATAKVALHNFQARGR